MAGDGMSASVDVARGEPVDAEQLAAALARAGVVFGVDTEACQRLAESLSDPELCIDGVPVAVGVPAQRGSDGYFSPAFAPGIKPGHIGEDGKMDFRDRELLKPVMAKSPLGVLHPAVEGRAGTRVDGGMIAVPPVRQASLALGPGVLRSPEGQLSAAVDGVILYVAGARLDVVRQHKHRGDVDLRSGHLDMAGSLSVGGDVQRLFHVRATGDVEIAGSVIGGSVHAGGSVSVKGTVRGGSGGELTAGGDVRARSAERAQIRSRGLLKLDSAVHCLLEAAVIEVGVLRGGEAHAERAVIVREVGVANGGDASIVAGEPLELVRDDVRAAISNAKNERWQQRARGGGANAERGRGGNGGRARPSLKSDDLERLLMLRSQREQLLQTSYVLVQGVAHPGVTIRFGDVRLTLTQEHAATRFSYHSSTRSISSERFVP